MREQGRGLILEPKPVYNAPHVTQTRSINASVKPRTASVILPLDVIHVVEQLLRARNRGHDEVLVRVRDWCVVDHSLDNL